jgi:hypothetical protein
MRTEPANDKIIYPLIPVLADAESQHLVIMNAGNLSITAPRMDEAEYRAEKDNLTSEERELAERDLYGKDRELPEETPAFLAQIYSELRVEMDSIRDKAAYLRAVEVCPEYAQDKAFALLFLRADYFDVKVRSGCCKIPAQEGEELNRLSWCFR